MRGFQGLLLIGGIFVVIGIYLLTPPTRISMNDDANILSGDYYYGIVIDINNAGHISGSFSQPAGNTVTLTILNSDQYVKYQDWFPEHPPGLPRLFETSGSQGGFGVRIDYPGTYYIILEHGPGASGGYNTNQTVRLTYVIDGLNSTYLGSGIASLLVGLLLAVAGYRGKQRKTTPSKVTDVINIRSNRLVGHSCIGPSLDSLKSRIAIL